MTSQTHSPQSGYCTNVHAGIDLDSIIENLRVYAEPARQLSRPNGLLGIGLWVPAEAASQLKTFTTGLDRLRKTCTDLGLEVFTFNGFPYGNFHQKVVKHRVYEPDWTSPNRLQYTEDLIEILDSLLPKEATGSISTLPIGWGKLSDGAVASAAQHLKTAALKMRRLEERSGRRIVLALEPEPGCTLDTVEDVIEFFEAWVAPQDRRYLTVCHDICHSAVMFEAQQEVLQKYAKHGITIGKFQISSAISVPWSELNDEESSAALAQLREFAEDRYLHQTGRKTASGRFTLAEDLPQLLSFIPHHFPSPSDVSNPLAGDTRWCIHFHVPIHLQRFGHLHGTQNEILECLKTLKHIPANLWIPHFEIETYAWSVLPESMRRSGLAESIAAEVRWFDQYGIPEIR